MKKFLSEWWVYLLIIAALAFLLWPLLRPGFFVSDDGEWMIIRLSAFFQSLRQGQFPVRFLGRLNQSYGYPVANFLYPGFMYLGSLIRAAGFSFVDTVKIVIALSVVGSALTVFLWLRTRFDRLPAAVGAVAFILAPYIIFDIYRRGSVGEVLALFPAVVGFYSLSTGRRWLFSLAVGFLILSHNTLAMLFVGVYILYMSIHRKNEFLLPLTIGIGIAGFFWLPAFFERRFVIFDNTVISDPGRFFVTAENIGLLGVANLLIALSLLMRPRKKWDRTNIFFLTIFIVAIILATPLSSVIWSWRVLARLIQFPYRWLAVSTVAAPWMFASVLTEVPKGIRFAMTALSLVILLIFAIPMLQKIQYIAYPEGYYTTNEATTTVADEYMPRWVIKKPERRPAAKIEFVLGKGKIYMNGTGTQRINATVEAAENSIVQINTIYYPGWGAALDGVPATINYRNPYGVMRIAVPSGRHKILAEFRETPARLLADVVSIVSLAALGILTPRWKTKKT